jgi:hypothetical protein
MKMRNVILFASLAGFFVTNSLGVIEFKDGGHYIIDYHVDDDVYVDYETPGMNTRVDLIDGGLIYILASYEDSIVNMSGGEVTTDLDGWGRSQVNVNAGIIDRDLNAFGNCILTLSGGYIGRDIGSFGDSVVTVSGGDIHSDMWSGGTDTYWDKSVIIFKGNNFAINGIPANYGQYYATDYATGVLSGNLIDGGTLNNTFYINDGASIVLIPEPGMVLLLGLGGLILRRRKGLVN